MKVSLNISCECDKTKGYCLKRITTKQPHMNNPLEIWISCDCGAEYYLGNVDDIVG
ncbi:hypothetical protein PQE68_gp081 [Bacillus phage vB_BanS_Sophrita]|uniref:Uncharacterized protein n=1 Tax=Bacillus phage vB_BanS_Sophrita TaxID=2894790 RepID=A0AAE9CE88_9CAUD|nr:hypothetical protein PQE68_gp081 [Bacillus phage vB_BanS_Sophrita]UGO50672.1 hypothetical protein SOPHRITA_81 [Bacillus phage vB_BanS_Sophrita]